MGSVSTFAMSSPRAYHEIEQFGKSVVDARNDDGENEHDDEHNARSLERLAESRPRDALELGERLLDLAPHADENVGLLVFILLGILAGRFGLLFGRLGLFLQVLFLFRHDIFP